MDSGKISLFLKLKPSSASTLLDTSLCKIVSSSELQLIAPPNKRRPFHFSRIFRAEEAQASLNEEVSIPLVRQVLHGHNACVIVLGSKSAGKTTSLYGGNSSDSLSEGLVLSCLTSLFRKISQMQDTSSVVVMVSFIELMFDQIKDLGLAYSKRADMPFEEILAKFNHQSLDVKESNSKSYVESVELIQVSSENEVAELIKKAFLLRETTGIDRSNAHTVLSVSVSQKPANSKTTKSSRIVFADISSSEFPQFSADGTAHLDISALKNVINKANLLYRNVPFVNVPFKANKLTHILQSVFTGTTYSNILTMIDMDASKYDETSQTLNYSKSLLEIDKKIKRNIVDNTDETDVNDLVARLEEEIEELRGSFKKVQSYHEDRLKYLSKLIGIDEDLEALLHAERGSASDITAKKYREAKSTVSTLKFREKQLKEKLMTNKNILEEIKLVNRNNQQKNERELIELENQIRLTRDELDDLKDRQSNIALENALISTQDLEKLLMHSHLILEEKSALIHNLAPKMTTRSSMIKGLKENWEQGITETQTLLRKKVMRNEAEFREQLSNIEAQLKHILQNREDSIRNMYYSVSSKHNEIDEEFDRIKNESTELFGIAKAHATMIRQIRNGSYNNMVVPMMINQKDMESLTNLKKFNIIANASRGKDFRPKTQSSLKETSNGFNRYRPRPPQPVTPGTINITLEDCFSSRLPPSNEKAACGKLQMAVKEMMNEVRNLSVKTKEANIEGIKANYSKLLYEKSAWEKQYRELVKIRLGKSSSVQHFSAEQVFRRGIQSKPAFDYTDLKFNRIPIVPKSSRRQIGTARPGDRLGMNGRIKMQ